MRKHVLLSSIDRAFSKNAQLTSFPPVAIFGLLFSPLLLLFRSKSSSSSASLSLSAATASNGAFPMSEITASDDDEEEELDASRCVIQNKDLLRKSQISGLHVLDLIDRGALESDPTLYNKLLNRCAQLGKLREGRIVHAHFLRSQFKHYLVIQNTVLNIYAKCNSLDEARKVFDDMPTKDMVTWTTLITGYSQNDRPP